MNEATTATNPTLVPNKADPDTGLSWKSADILGMTAGGTNVMQAASSHIGLNGMAPNPATEGNWGLSLGGIGTTGQGVVQLIGNPTTTGPAGLYGVYHYDSGSYTRIGGMRVSRGANDTSGTMTLDVRNGASGLVSAITVTSAGLVGIGTTSPTSPLTITTGDATPAIQVTHTVAGENVARIIGSHASFTGNVLQPWTTRAAGTAFDLIECVTNNGSEVPFRVRGDGAVTMSGALTIGASVIATTDTDTTNTGSVTLDFAANQNFVLTFTGNVTLANPSTEQVGQAGVIVCIQDATGSRTLTLGTDYETAGGSGITLSTDANAVDVIPYFVKASGSIQLGAVQKAFS
jgi:hypothetical protein